MFAVDKEKFGQFVSTLRKDTGMTQKELAAALFVSDKAVSKWETGQSIPDVSLLIPLADILGVTVTELLQGERLETSQPISAGEVENIVKQAVSLAEGGRKSNKKIYAVRYIAAAVVGLIGIYNMQSHIYFESAVVKNTVALVAMAAAAGAYTIFFAPAKLPRYYDGNSISAYSHGIVRMNLPGVNINNSNWPHILRRWKIWSVITMVSAPFVMLVTAYLTEYIFVLLSPDYPNPLSRVDTWETAVTAVSYFIYLGSMVFSVYRRGRKYE